MSMLELLLSGLEETRLRFFRF